MVTTKHLYTVHMGWFSLEYPGDWCVEESDQLVTLYRPEIGSGALQISAFRTPGEQDTRKELLEYLADKDLSINEASITVQQEGPKEVSTYDYVEDEWYWRVWMISRGSHFLFITYNCEVADREKELDSVVCIVASITIDP